MLKAPIALLFILPAVAALAQAPAPPIPAEPPVTLKAGETPVAGECLTRQELDLNKGLEALKRPTRGAENPDHDDQPRFNPQYFVGQWRIEGVLPESPFGPAGDYTGTETIRHVDGCTYEGTIQANLSGRAYSVKIRMFYDRKAHYLVRVEDDSRGFQLVKAGLVGGDAGGYFTHYWDTGAMTYQGKKIHLTGATFVASPVNHRLRMQLAVDDQPSVNYGTTWWRREGSKP